MRRRPQRRGGDGDGAGAAPAQRPVTTATAAVALLLLLAAAAPQPAAAQDVTAILQLNPAAAALQFGWAILADPPSPAAVKVPAGETAKVTYTVTYQRTLLSTKLQVSGTVKFANRGKAPMIVLGGQVTICNGFFAEAPNATAKGGAGGAGANGGCSGSTYSIPLPQSLTPPKSAPGAAVGVPFSGSVSVNRVVSSTMNGDGLNGPVATAYVDAYLTNGVRVVSSPQRVVFDLSPGGQNNHGEVAVAYDEFVPGIIPPLTIYPAFTTGDKIPDDIGLTMADSNTYTYTAGFRYEEGKTPCDIPLSAVNTQRLYVVDPGVAPLPEPSTTAATVTFTGCKAKSAGRFGRILPNATATVRWGLAKSANATSVRVKRGGREYVKYIVEATRPEVQYSYTLSGSVFVSPKDGILGNPALAVQSVEVSASGGGPGAPATCGSPRVDGSIECSFSGVPYRTDSLAPIAGTLSAVITLKDGSRIDVPPEGFDFTELPLDFLAGSKAEVGDAFAGPSLDKARAAGVQADWNRDFKAPGGSDGTPPLLIEDARTFEYVVTIWAAADSECGPQRLTNVATLTPLGGAQAPLTASTNLAVEVYGC